MSVIYIASLCWSIIFFLCVFVEVMMITFLLFHLLLRDATISLDIVYIYIYVYVYVYVYVFCGIKGNENSFTNVELWFAIAFRCIHF